MEEVPIIPKILHESNADMDEEVTVCVVPLLFALIISTILSNLYIPHELVGMLVGGGLGVIVYTVAIMRPLATNFWQPQLIIVTLQPALMLKMVYNIDTFLFIKSLPQILLISTVGLVIYVLLFGLLLMLFNNKEINLVNVVMAGTILAPIDVPDIILELERVKNLEVLMDGESVFGTAICLMTFAMCLKIYANDFQTDNATKEILVFYMKYILLSTAVSIPCGKIAAYVFRKVFNDALNAVILVVASSYAIFFLCEEILKCNGNVACFILLYCISLERSKLPADVDRQILIFLEVVNAGVEYIATVALSAFVIFRVIDLYKNFDAAIAVCVYFIGNAVRLLVLLLLTPILSRIGYGFNFTSMIAIFWAAKKGPMQIVTTISLSYHEVINVLGAEMLIYTLVYLVLIFLLNGTTLKFILRKFGLIDFSTARKNNINNCFRFIDAKRQRLISSMKMNRFYSDANWSVIQQNTKIVSPYAAEIGVSEEDNKMWGQFETYCNSCKKKVAVEPNKKEVAEITREVRMRMLKAMRVSFARQFENGTLNKDGVRALLQAVEIAMDSEDLVIKVDDLFRRFKGNPWIEKMKKYLLRFKTMDNFKLPRTKFQKICYAIITYKNQQYIWDSLVMINMIIDVVGIILGPNGIFDENVLMLLVANTVFLFVYIAEFFITATVYCVAGIAPGLKSYFKSRWNAMVFTLLCVNIIDNFLIIVLYAVDMTYENQYCIFYVSVSLRLSRILVFCKALDKLNPKLVTYCDKLIDVKVSSAFTIGKALVMAFEEVIELLPKVCVNDKIRDNVRLHIENDKLSITREMGLLEKDRPWIAITVKTKQAMISTLISMQNAVLELKASGVIDSFEFEKLNTSLNECFKQAAIAKSVETMSPKNIFYEVPWMSEDREICDYLYKNVTTKIWDAGDIICRQGQVAEGIFILVTGLFKITYVPTKEYLDNLGHYGALPVKDLLKNTRFEEIQEEYIMMGNSIGELSVLTGRPYSCTVISETPSQAFIIRSSTIKEALQISKDPVNGLASRLWKYVAWNLCRRILIDTATYESTMHDELYFVLDRGVVPNFSCYKILALSDMVEDILLIEGLIIDYNTRDVYTAPCYIPRTVQKVVLTPSDSTPNNVPVRLMIIPSKDANVYLMMERCEDKSDLYAADSDCFIRNVMPEAYFKSSRAHKSFKATT